MFDEKEDPISRFGSDFEKARVEAKLSHKFQVMKSSNFHICFFEKKTE